MTENQKSVEQHGARRMRADAQRNLDRLIQSARVVFEMSGLDAPIREIADHADVGIATLYRHFPRREDLIAAVFHNEIDDCVDAAGQLAEEYGPYDALAAWAQRFVVLAGTKHGIANVLTLDDPAFAGLGAKREQGLRPAFRGLFQAALAAGEIRSDVDADEVMDAIASLCSPAYAKRPDHAQRMVTILIEGLRTKNF
ncbi:TetR/AcrR family transcriptional regulator [Mycolicibacterium aubagnense]